MPYKDPEKQREWNRQHREQRNASSLRWAHEHREQHNANGSKWHNEHREQHNAVRRLRRARFVAFVREQKVGKVCVQCGEANIDRLHFHHVDPTTRCFVIGHGYDHDEKIILAEIAKCVLLCRSCHATHHWQMRRRKEAEAYAAGRIHGTAAATAAATAARPAAVHG